MPLFDPPLEPGNNLSDLGNVTTALANLGIKLPAASVNYKPGSPTTTTSTTAVLMGLGSTCFYTPTGSGKVLVVASAVLLATSTATGAESVGYYGTLAAPVADATTVAAGSNGGEISTIASWGGTYGGNGVLAVASVTGWSSSGGSFWVAASGSTVAQCAYTGISGSTLTGCTYVAGSASGTVATGGSVTPYPQNGAPAAGTIWSATQTSRIATSSATIGLGASYNDRLSLSANQAYWFDLGLYTNTGSDGVGMINVSMTLAEQLA